MPMSGMTTIAFLLSSERSADVIVRVIGADLVHVFLMGSCFTSTPNPESHNSQLAHVAKRTFSWTAGGCELDQNSDDVIRDDFHYLCDTRNLVKKKIPHSRIVALKVKKRRNKGQSWTKILMT